MIRVGECSFATDAELWLVTVQKLYDLTTSEITHISDTSSSITEVLPLLLQRIARLLVGTISFPALANMLRAVYVEEGKKKLERSGAKATKSALALITGLDTRVVSATLKETQDPTDDGVNANPENALIDLWCSDQRFYDQESKTPIVLPIEGKGRTFQSLVLSAIGRNVTVKTVLDRLLESETVQIIQGDIPRVELISLHYNPISSDRAKLTDITFLEASRVMSAGIHNMNSAPEERVPQQGRWTYRLSPDNYREFRREARDLLQKQIKEGEALLERFEEPSKQPGQLTVGIGWYQWGDHDIEVTEATKATGEEK